MDILLLKYLGTWVTETAEQKNTLQPRYYIRTENQSAKMLYMEAWILKSENIKNIEAFEMWCYRRKLRIPWVDKVSNEEVLRRMNKSKETGNTIKKRKFD